MTVDQKKEAKLIGLNNWREEKEGLALDFFDKERTVKDIKVSRWEVFNCYLGENIGHEQCKKRPVLILSSDFFNDRTSTVTIAPLSTTIITKVVQKGGRSRRVLKFKSQYRLHSRKFDFLVEDSVVKLDQLKTVCKSRLIDKLGSIDECEEVKEGINFKLRTYLDL